MRRRSPFPKVRSSEAASTCSARRRPSPRRLGPQRSRVPDQGPRRLRTRRTSRAVPSQRPHLLRHRRLAPHTERRPSLADCGPLIGCGRMFPCRSSRFPSADGTHDERGGYGVNRPRGRIATCATLSPKAKRPKTRGRVKGSRMGFGSAGSDDVFTTRALAKFVAALEGRESPVVVDLGAAVGANVTFLGDRLGCKLHVADILSKVETWWSPVGSSEETTDVDAAALEVEHERRRLARRLDHSSDSADGVLGWDVFDYLDDEAAPALAHRGQNQVCNRNPKQTHTHTHPHRPESRTRARRFRGPVSAMASWPLAATDRPTGPP